MTPHHPHSSPPRLLTSICALLCFNLFRSGLEPHHQSSYSVWAWQTLPHFARASFHHRTRGPRPPIHWPDSHCGAHTLRRWSHCHSLIILWDQLSSSSSSLSNREASVPTNIMTSSPVVADNSSLDDNPAKSSPLDNKWTSSTAVTTQMWASIGSSTSLVVAGGVWLATVVYRDAWMVTMGIGSVANALLGKILKKVIGQDRPLMVKSEEDQDRFTGNQIPLYYQPQDDGMPSSHATSLGFIFTFASLLMRWSMLPHAATIITLLWIYAATSLSYRIQVRLHTWQQVAVGLALGGVNAYLCYQWAIQGGIDWLQSATPLFEPDTGLVRWPLMIIPTLAAIGTVGESRRKLKSFFQGWLAKKDKID